jgi:PAS domain S-box-containing protein
MLDFLIHLFDTSDFPARWHCGNWTTGHGWLHILSDLGVWSAYVAIACILVFFVVRRKHIPFRTIFLLFAAFIFASGTIHLMEAISFWWPAYRLAGLIKLLTAIVSWGTVAALIPVTPKGLTWRAPEDLEREIAAHKKTEAALLQANTELQTQIEAAKSSEERFRLFADSTKDYAFFFLDPAGRIATWNPGAERIKGYRAEQIIGQHFSVFYPAEEAKAGEPQRALQVAAAERRFEDESWRVRQDGSRFWANVVITALRDDAGNLRGFSKVTRDLTEKKAADENARRLLQEEAARRTAEEYAETLRAQREQLQVTLQSIGDGVITTDAHGLVTSLNPMAQGLTGWGEDARGKPLEEVFKIVNEQTRQKVENPVSRVLREGRVIGLANHTVLIARDGTERPIDDSASPIRGDDGAIHGVVMAFRDVTEKRKTEEALKRSLTDLREADKRKDEFLATLAHELRNPLAPLRTALEVFRLAGTDAELMQQARSMMERQLMQMVRLVDDLLDVSRITRGKIELRKERVDLAAAIQMAVETTQPVIEASGHELTVSFPTGSLLVDGDITRLAQVFANLLNNAARYTKRSGHIWLTAERQGDEAVVTVRDTGVGIPQEMLAHVFELFTQVDNAREGGLGIGLTLVRRLTEMHGGQVEVRSEGRGRGSEFVVRLPVVPESAAPQIQPYAGGAKAGARGVGRILVVDDNHDAAVSLATMLRLTGYEVHTAHDGIEAVAAAEEFRPDVALLDLGLPGQSGYDVACRIRERPWGKEVVLIALTGWGQQADRHRSTEAGFDHHLVKPVEPEALRQLLAGLKRSDG